MTRSYIPLNALRAFEAAARHLSFTHAAIELNVTHSAISQQVKTLEEHLNCQLFVRVSRGLMLTTEGENLLPVLNDSFDRIADTLDRFSAQQLREKLKIGVVGTFAVGFLLPRLEAFRRRCPHIDLHLSTHNNRVDPAAEGLDYTIRFGSGAWHGTEAIFLCDAPLSALCAPGIAEMLHKPADVLNYTLLRSYRRDEWAAWLTAAGEAPPAPTHPVMVFDTSLAMLEAAQCGAGIAIAPTSMFSHLLNSERIVQPFPTQISLGGYWLTRLQSRPETAAMRDFAAWIATQW
ncbi:MAG: LysR family transcriptional regulator AmpR [Yokenella regensburgei]|jgi:LysR family transcriptional regulator of beta-lactamase|uniref:HTH-type transcriptional activator AmpR n=1 Tax=Yokenella regensburgei TaxID=158877 RepID=A0AB38FX05_9ENTR|nr:LysR family transcriptional regulator AmpR [Yokenella regensburgei]KFD25089.1 glycine cleavage system transcriptional activator [Yokenella regensburgei ATCC 49455]MDQ4429660.1 LysR family transcriptional regulator AmpR [Yokenella regensburgei]MDR2217271.1 LysR family transcriptional regulator AmpR [Yokenella regensburgei]MDR3103043.1 LysR family transcriptional regulator AmpR [Yokenella regensburgei]RKR53668.1 LysR family transcriptional regulator of beta-lactamase [Yokenella regensburgei]